MTLSPRTKRDLALITALGAVARLIAIAFHPALHPDEFFQYLEPAWKHLHGYGWMAWEWSVGLRSWLLPGYHGAWMELLGWLGIRRGEYLLLFFQVHWALVSATMAIAGFIAGRAMTREFVASGDTRLEGDAHEAAIDAGGLLAAFACALFPTLVYFGPHTLTEVPSMLLFVWGYALWADARTRPDRESVRRGIAVGLLLSLGACIRIPNAPLALIPPIDWILRGRFRTTLAVVLGALVPVAVSGALDWATWGRPFHSAIAFIDYNFVQGRAAEHGQSPPLWYVEGVIARTGGFLLVMAIALARGFRRVWTWALPALLLLAYLSTQPHKEERFLVLFWPLLLTAAAASAAGWIALRQVQAGERVSALWMIVCAVVLGLFVEDGLAIAHEPASDFTGKFAVYEAQAWVGQRPDLTGLLIEDRVHLNGGYMLTSKNIPQNVLANPFVNNPLFNYVIARETTAPTGFASLGFVRVWSTPGYVVYRRGK
jgi:phosphatidylinositol glycan class B